MIDTSLDNASSAICPKPVVINALDLAFAKHIWTSSSSDPLVLCAINSLKEGLPLFSCSTVKNWTFENGHLYYKGRMYIPPAARHTLVISLHNSPTLGHAGQFHTKTFLKCDFWWLGLSTYINKFIDRCAVCQQNKVNTHLTYPLLNPIPSTSPLPFKQLSVDLVTDLPLVKGLDSIMVVVDHGLMKGVIIIPCSKTIDMAEVGKLFFQNVFKQFSLHNTSISERGPQFASALARKLAQFLKYDVRLSTAYHPQTNRQTE